MPEVGREASKLAQRSWRDAQEERMRTPLREEFAVEICLGKESRCGLTGAMRGRGIRELVTHSGHYHCSLKSRLRRYAVEVLGNHVDESCVVRVRQLAMRQLDIGFSQRLRQASNPVFTSNRMAENCRCERKPTRLPQEQRRFAECSFGPLETRLLAGSWIAHAGGEFETGLAALAIAVNAVENESRRWRVG